MVDKHNGVNSFRKLNAVTVWLSLILYLMDCSIHMVVCEKNVSSVDARVLGYDVLSEKYNFDDDFLVIESDVQVVFNLYGRRLDLLEAIAFTSTPPFFVTNDTTTVSCEHPIWPVFAVTKTANGTYKAMVHTRGLREYEDRFYICGRFRRALQSWTYQGAEGSLSVMARTPSPAIIPSWLQYILLIILFFLSGLFSGLNLGLMSLNVMELKIVESAGSDKERVYAKKIRPVRRHGNYLLCTLLLGNVLVNTSLTLMLDALTGSGMYAVIASTLGITIFGEILPQALCSRYGMAVGAHTIVLTKVFMVITSPLSFPISFILDKLLGDEMGQEYTREKLRELIKQQNEMIQQDEMNIITGALSLTTKTVHDIMTPLDKAYMISADAVLDFDTLNEIVRHGYTRVPIYDGERGNIRSVLNVKDLAFIDPGTKTSVMTVCDFYQRPILIIDQNESLERMLRTFRQGKTHMAFVENVVSNGDGDPYREMVGLVTLEDVIEEILQAEIMDETDTYVDNQQNFRRRVSNQDFSVFNKPNSTDIVRLPPQLKMAALRHLLCNVESFREKYIDKAVLQNLLNTDIVSDHIVKKGKELNLLYSSGVTATYALLVVQGRVIVEVTTEKLIFEAGPFMFFGESMLFAVNKQLENLPSSQWSFLKTAELPSFVPDYTVHASTDLKYLKITAPHYLFARTQSKLFHQKGKEGRKSDGGDGSVAIPLYADGSPRHFNDDDSVEYDSTSFNHAWRQHCIDDKTNSSNSNSALDPNQIPLELLPGVVVAAAAGSSPTTPTMRCKNIRENSIEQKQNSAVSERTNFSERASLLV